MFKKKPDNPELNQDLTEEEYMYLDSVLLFMRFAKDATPNLDKILRPIAFDLMDKYYHSKDRPLPIGDVKALGTSEIPNLSNLLGGRLR